LFYYEFIDVPRFRSADNDNVAIEEQVLPAIPFSADGRSLHKRSTGTTAINNEEAFVMRFNLKVLTGNIQGRFRFDQIKIVA
jgi:hypothetical protein